VLDDGPWFFRGNAVLLEEYDGISKPSTMEFKNLSLWARVYDLPTSFRTQNIGHQNGEKIRKFLKVELDDEANGWRDYLCIRVKLEIEKPLTRIVYVSTGDKGNPLAFQVKYEKLPKFCAICGLIGHVDSECGDCMHDKAAYQYGDWLIASPERKGGAKGSRSSSLKYSKGLDSKETGKILALQGKSGDSNQINLDGGNAELRNDARSQLKRNCDQQLFFVKNGPCNTKSLNVTND
jgi:hypothetical protein